jgi:hypothetical protein
LADAQNGTRMTRIGRVYADFFHISVALCDFSVALCVILRLLLALNSPCGENDEKSDEKSGEIAKKYVSEALLWGKKTYRNRIFFCYLIAMFIVYLAYS